MGIFVLSFKGEPIHIFDTEELEPGELHSLRCLADCGTHRFQLDRTPSDREMMLPLGDDYDNLAYSRKLHREAMDAAVRL